MLPCCLLLVSQRLAWTWELARKVLIQIWVLKLQDVFAICGVGVIHFGEK